MGQRVFAGSFEAGGKSQDIRFGEWGKCDHRSQARLAFGERARLVQDERVDLLHQLERFGLADEDAGTGAAPVATMMLIGVARPSAQGQAMISTETACTSACAKRGSVPTNSQTTNVTTATAITIGTNHAATRSASRWIG